MTGISGKQVVTNNIDRKDGDQNRGNLGGRSDSDISSGNTNIGEFL